MAQKLTKVAEVTDLESTDTIVVIDESVQNPDGSSGAVRRIKKSNMGINSKADYITVNGVKYPITSITKTTVGTNNLPSLVVAYDDGADSTVVLPDATAMGIVSEDIYSEVRTKVSDIKVNGVTQDKDASGVVNLTISDDTKADAIVKTASGSIASFSDGGDGLPMKSLKVNIVPKQSGSGDPSPSNVRPISGWDAVDVNKTGANVWDEEWQAYSATQIRSKNPIPLVRGATYYYKAPTGAGIYYDGGMIPLDPNTSFTVPNDYVPGLLYTGDGYGSSTYRNDISINYPATDHEYHPYDGQTITTNLGQTVYGGTLDVVSGKLVIDKQLYNLRNHNSSFIYAYPFNGTQGAYIDYALQGDYTRVNGWCDSAPVSTETYYNSSQYMWFGVSSSAIYWIGILDVLGLTIDGFKTWLGNHDVYVVTPLTTPTEITLTPQQVKSLLGSNNIWSESGTVDVEYRADTTLAYNELLNLIANM